MDGLDWTDVDKLSREVEDGSFFGVCACRRSVAVNRLAFPVLTRRADYGLAGKP